MIQLNENNPFVMHLVSAPLTAIVMHYASCLLTNTKAIAFVADELNATPEQATEMQIGFSDRSLGTLIPPRQVKTGREIRERLVELGIYKVNGRETLRGYVTVPIRDEQGLIIGIRGHKVDRHAAGEAVIKVGGKLDQRRETGGRREEVLATDNPETTENGLQCIGPESVSGEAIAADSNTRPIKSTVPTQSHLRSHRLGSPSTTVRSLSPRAIATIAFAGWRRTAPRTP
jgi:hypothetical protein